MMTIVRFASPRLEARLGAPALLRITFSGAVVGLLLVAFAPHYTLAVAGVALWGIGASLGFPLGISALSTDPVMTPARVSVLPPSLRRGPHRPAPPGYHRRPHRLPQGARIRGSTRPPRDRAGRQVPDQRGRTRTDIALDD